MIMAAALFRGTTHAKLYQKYRIIYPASVYNIILKYLADGLDPSGQKAMKFGTGLDIGCGTGISTLPLCDHFQSVIGVDVSEAQLEEARKASSGHANVTYRLGSAHDLAFQKDETVDLVTIAQAMHWVDTGKFYRECHRLLRPGGVLAAYGYGFPLARNPDVHNVVMHFHDVTLNGFWEDGRKHLGDCYAELYKGFSVAFPNTERIDSVMFEKNYSLDDLIGYLRSWSGYQTLRKRHPEAEDPLIDVAARLRKIHSATNTTITGDSTASDKMSGVTKSDEKATGTDGDGDKSTGVTDDDSNIRMSVVSPIFILLGRKPVST